VQTPAKGKRATGKNYEEVIDNLGIREDEEKPFWAKFLKSDHEEEPKSLLGGVLAVLDGNKTLHELKEEREGGPKMLEHLEEADYEQADYTQA
jgi:hypothetical protein